MSQPENEIPNRKLFRFTLRDLLWMMLVVGLLLGWTIDHRYLIGRNNELEIKLGITNIGTVLSALEDYLLDEGYDVSWSPGKFSIRSPNASGISITDDGIPVSKH
jgi:hypothetical protein